MTRDDLIAFEDSIAEEFNAGKIPYPVHLENGNEDALIRVFQDVGQDDWIFGSWRMHSKALLKIDKHPFPFEKPEEIVRSAIHRGESMALRFPEHRVYGSAIVGGTIPIALGTAMSIKRNYSIRSDVQSAHVWCFLGDMTAESGIFAECRKYAANFDLPMTWVVEDNGVSVCTNTEEAWGGIEHGNSWSETRYEFKSKYPHSGAGKRVQF